MNTGSDSYEQKLRDLTDHIPGGISANLTGIDGIGIASYSLDNSIDPALADAEFATMLAVANRSAVNLGAGSIEELMVATGALVILLRLVGTDFYISVCIQAGVGNLGLARLHLRRVSDELMKMLY